MITGTHINYYYVCKRKLWLFANSINMEHTSDRVYDGKMLHETAYDKRSEQYKEIEIGSIKVDYYDRKERIIHEVKRSAAIEDAHFWQLKYYIYVFRQAGIYGVKGIIEYPKLRQTKTIELTEEDVSNLEDVETEIERITESDKCPPTINSKICKKCSYYDFCFSGEG